MGFRGYLPVTYRGYYAITTWGPLMGPMLCTKESRYVRMQLRSTVYTRVQKTRSHAPRVAAFISHTPIHPIQPSTVLSILEETVTHEIQYFRYVTFERAAAFTSHHSPVADTTPFVTTETFPSGWGDICRAATVARNATETRRVLLLFLLFNRNARWCSSTSGSNLLPVRLHRPIDNRAATTTSLVCTYVRTCSFMLLIFKCASVETVLFPPSPSLEHVFVSRSQERYYMRVLYSSLSRGTNNTKIYRNNDVQRYFIAKRQSVEMYYNRYRIIYRIGHRCCRHYFWQLSHNLKHVTVLSVLNSFRILNRGDIRSYYAQLNTY